MLFLTNNKKQPNKTKNKQTNKQLFSDKKGSEFQHASQERIPDSHAELNRSGRTDARAMWCADVWSSSTPHPHKNQGVALRGAGVDWLFWDFKTWHGDLATCKWKEVFGTDTIHSGKEIVAEEGGVRKKELQKIVCSEKKKRKSRERRG